MIYPSKNSLNYLRNIFMTCVIHLLSILIPSIHFVKWQHHIFKRIMGKQNICVDINLKEGKMSFILYILGGYFYSLLCIQIHVNRFIHLKKESSMVEYQITLRSNPCKFHTQRNWFHIFLCINSEVKYSCGWSLSLFQSLLVLTLGCQILLSYSSPILFLLLTSRLWAI